MLRLLEQEHPEYLAVAFDTGRTFRDDLFAEYKGTREKMPDELRTQIERIRQMVDAFNIPRLEIEKAMKPMMCWAAWRIRLSSRGWGSRSSPAIAICSSW